MIPTAHVILKERQRQKNPFPERDASPLVQDGKAETGFHPRFPCRSQSLLGELEVMAHLQNLEALKGLGPLALLEEMKEVKR